MQQLFRLPQVLLLGLVRGYRFFLSPWLGSACRFTPSCSVYAIEALQQHGAMAGTYLTAARLVRCQPWCAGGHDPVPSQLSASHLFTGLKALPTAAASASPPAYAADKPHSFSVSPSKTLL